MRILFVSAWFPHPPVNGSRLRVNLLLRSLAARHDVALVSFADRPDVDPAAPEMRALCRTAEVLPRPRFDPAAWRSRLAWAGAAPRSLTATFSEPMADAVARAARTCDVLVASQLACAAYAPHFGDAPALFEEVELGAQEGRLAHAAGAERWLAQLSWIKYRHYVRGLLRRFRACTVVSDREREVLAAVLGDARAIHVLPNGVAVDDYACATPRHPDLAIFTGSLDYGPNYDAMRWFVREVWPTVRRSRPAARLLITGDRGRRPLPAADGVEQVGLVEDVRPLLAGAALAVAPIFTGGGTRLKILEAMAAGTPVVATTKGAEGIDAVDGQHLLLADEPVAFAAHVIAVLEDATLRDRLSQAAHQLVEARYDWRILGPRFEALVSSVAGVHKE
jgi:polysaccharide biosynthesis protein PslH